MDGARIKARDTWARDINLPISLLTELYCKLSWKPISSLGVMCVAHIDSIHYLRSGCLHGSLIKQGFSSYLYNIRQITDNS